MKIISLILNYNDAHRAKSLAEKNALMRCIDLVIIVDNCSTDDSWNILSNISHPKIFIVKTEKNGGFAYGNNYGFKIIENIDYQFVFISNTDTIYEEEDVLACVRTLENEPSIGVVSMRIKGMDGIEQNSAWKFQSFIGFLGYCTIFGRYLKKEKKTKLDMTKPVLKVDIVRGSFMFFRKKAISKCQGFDEFTFLYGEEAMICSRLKAHGYSTALLTRHFYLHNHINSEVKDFKKSPTRQMLRSMYHFQTHYRHISWYQKMISILFMGYAIITDWLVGQVKHFFNMKSKRRKENGNSR